MNKISRHFFISLLVIALISIHLPQLSFAQVSKTQSNTMVPIEYVSSPETDVESTFISRNWWIIVLGLILVGGAVALAGGGGDSSPTPTTPGNVAFSW